MKPMTAITMTAIKNGIRSILRAPVKTLLFVLIFTLTTALLSVSCCVYTAVSDYLGDCEDYFHTIAEFEYIGDYYPDRLVYDEELADTIEDNRSELEALISSDDVISWEPATSALMYTPKIKRFDKYMPDPDVTVLKLHLRSYNAGTCMYNAIVTETLYSRKDYTDKLVMLRTITERDSLPYPGDYYIAGHFFSSKTQSTSMKQEVVSFFDGEKIVKLPAALEDGTDAGKEAQFRRYAEILHVKNDACPVTYTRNIEDLYPFHQQLLTLKDGRFFTSEEYASKARTCIVSEKISGLLELEVGDSIPLTIVSSSGDIFDDTKQTQLDEGDYEIVGITPHSDNYPYYIFLPDAGIGTDIRPVNGYTLGQFRLRNSGVSDFLETAKPLIDRGFRLNIYDQGYSAATEPMKELEFISIVFLSVCLILVICVLALQGYLFISRQRESAGTMLAMGSGRSHICVYFLISTLALVVFGAAFGTFIGSLSESRVFEILREFALKNADPDLRFSSSKIAVTRTLEFDPTSSLRPYLTAIIILAAGAVIFTLVFALNSLREKKPRSKKKPKEFLPGREARTVKLSGFFKYGILSILRGNVRTAAVLVLGLTVAVFFGRLTDSLSDYRQQLETYKDNAVVEGFATDFYGKMISPLILKGGPVSKLAVSDMVESYCATTSLAHIRYLGVVNGEQIPFEMPTPGTYAYESAFYYLNKEPMWIGTSSILGNPLFSNCEGGSVTWLDGWSDEDFRKLYFSESASRESEYWLQTTPYQCGPSVCALPESMMREHGINLGDTINAVIAYSHPAWGEQISIVHLQVVASYVGPVTANTILSPVTTVCPGMEESDLFPFIREGKGRKNRFGAVVCTYDELKTFEEAGLSPVVTYNSFTFALKDSRRLDELRSFMEKSEFTWVRSNERNKTYAVIDDSSYLNTVHSMERQIRYVEVLYDVLYVLTGIIGAVLAWLLIRSRRREIGLMRALGTQHGRILGNFLAEQFLLMVFGLGLGMAVSKLTGALVSGSMLILIAAFLGLWILSTLICLIASLLKQSYASLNEPE